MTCVVLLGGYGRLRAVDMSHSVTAALPLLSVVMRMREKKEKKKGHL